MSARGPRPIAQRVGRLLVMLPWLMERGPVSVAEMARTFGVREAELIRDLELAAMCGMPPFLDELIDVAIDDGMVYPGIPRFFERPLRLSAPEGFALVTAAAAAADLVGAAPGSALARAMHKLEAALGRGGLTIEQDPPDVTARLRRAIEAGEVLELRYWAALAEEATERTVTPRAVFQDRGFWYLLADDHLRGEERSFRIDRIETVTTVHADAEPREVAVPSDPDWFGDSPLPMVTLRVDASVVDLMERYPLEAQRPHDDGGAQIELRVSSEEWLAGLLLWLGPRATVIAPEAWVDLAGRRARAMLARYGEAGSEAGSDADPDPDADR